MKGLPGSAIRWTFIILAVLVVSCRGDGAKQIADFESRSVSLPASLTVISWNIQKGKHPQLVSDLTILLEQEVPDIVFLQEVVDGLLDPEQMGGYFAESWRYPWPGGKTVGVLTLSRVPAARIQPLPTKHREFDVTAPKVSLATEYPLPDGTSLLAVNAHLLNFEQSATLRVGHQLEGLKSIMIRHTGPIILAGDFNTWNRERLELVRIAIRAVRLDEVMGFPAGRRTGDLDSEFWNGVLGIDKNLPLDRIFVRGYATTAARVLNFHSSDHPPILVDLERTP